MLLSFCALFVFIVYLILWQIKIIVFLDHVCARKHGLEGIIQADPNTFNHHVLFEKLQHLTLTHRLNDSYSCLV